ncbi:histidine ammonia-lyase [Bartonella sp. AR 15-3]|uniref:aromatic amino acid lyase n=1 Tax=Bartonella sp. AR 15-3 TaxID=545617 RepID=UPI0009CD071C|nr:aromatic amino acid lyase [Bartonella sp. AR 15-3]OPB31531.1 histidine ammonia-lyase [Bartonella sp. AR 15-3]
MIYIWLLKEAAHIAEIAVSSEPVYGINTGFGELASIKIDIDKYVHFAKNHILSHCYRVGVPTPENVVRLMMSLKLISRG